MDENGLHFQLGYNRLDLFLSPSDIERILQLENEKLKEPFSPPQFHPESTNSRIVFPTFFHPSEDELPPNPSLSPNHDIITEQPEVPELSPVSSLNSLSEIIIKSSADTFSTTTFETSTFAMNDTTAQGSILNKDDLLNVTSSSLSSFQWNSTNEWASEEIGAVFIICLMIPFIICSNLLVILSVIRFRRLHTPTNYFITSLAAVDIIVGLITPLVIAVQIFQHGENENSGNTLVCILPNRILMMSCGVSLLNLATIAYDRHTALICPLEYVNIMTSRKVAVLMVCSWIYSGFIVWLPLILGWYESSFPSSHCTVDHLHQKAHILFMTAIFVPACTIILLCYSRIFLVARHHAKSIAAVEFAVHRRLQVRFMIKDTKYAKTLALVIGGFLALWLPYLVYTFVKTISGVSVDVWLETYLILLAVLNSGINPWIYAFKNNEFQAAFKRMAREHCGSRFCLGESRRGSLVSGVSTASKLSRTNSRMAGAILEATTDYGLADKMHRNLGFMNSTDSELSDTTGTSSHNNTIDEYVKNDHSRSKYLCPKLYSTTCVFTNEREDQRDQSGDFSLKERNIQSGKDCQMGEDNPVYIRDETSYNTFQNVVLNVRQATKDHLNQIKRIKNKGTDIIRSASTLSSFSSIRPHVTTKDNNNRNPIKRIKNKGSNIIRSSSALSSLSSSIRPQVTKDRYNQMKKIKNKSSNIIRSSSALSYVPSIRHREEKDDFKLKQNKRNNKKTPGSDITRSSSALPPIRPHLLPLDRRPSASLPSSPSQAHNPHPHPLTPLTPKLKSSNNNKPPRISRFHSFCHPPPTPSSPLPPFQPLTPPIYPNLSSHYLHQHLRSPVLPRTQFSNYSPQTQIPIKTDEIYKQWTLSSGTDNCDVFHH